MVELNMYLIINLISTHSRSPYIKQEPKGLNGGGGVKE